jgi:biopolymer transport protein ExbD
MAFSPTDDADLKAEINVTPLVDVVLVLLVIFMVVAPLLHHEVPVELPVSKTARDTDAADQVTLAVADDGTLTLAGASVSHAELGMRLRELYAGRVDRTIFLAAARNLTFGAVVDVLDQCREAGVTTIGILARRVGTSGALPADGPATEPGGS